MKLNKKLMILLGILALSVTLTVGCNSGETPADDETTADTVAATEVATEEATAEETLTDAVDGTEVATETETVAETETELVTEAPVIPDVTVDVVEPDLNKVADMAVTGDGYDIYLVREDQGFAYRYGCTYLYTEDTIHAYFAAVGPGIGGDWDFITYQQSTDGGQTWSKEKVVLNPTRGSGSNDYLSTCDPGVVYFGGYYYIGYTSTLNLTGTANCVYVARSKNPDGPFEKWNGEGWGGRPEPIFYYDQDYTYFGIGEPSFVELNGTLYIYYTNICPSGDYMMVATADATDENWPATIQERGVGIKKNSDSVDVKYVEEWGKFVGIATSNRFTSSSYITVYESNDGLNFQVVDAVRENTYSYLHNAGLSSRINGHIRVTEDADKLCVVYAYGYVNGGDGWGLWNTRLQPISLTLSGKDDLVHKMNAEKAKTALDDPRTRAKAIAAEDRALIMVRPTVDVYEYAVSKGTFALKLKIMDEYMSEKEVTNRRIEGVTFTDYDTNIISIDNSTWKVTIKGVGSTSVIVNYQGLFYQFYVNITEESAGSDVVGLVPVKDTFVIAMNERTIYRPQIRVKLMHEDGGFNEYYVNKSEKVLAFSDYNTDLIKVTDDGLIYVKATGETEITVTLNGYSCKIKVIITDDASLGYFKTPSVDDVPFVSSDKD